MEKELKVFKEGTGNHSLLDYTEISGRHALMHFTSDIDIQEHDVIWASEDLVKGERKHMFVVIEVKEDGGVIARDPDRGFLKDYREFRMGEVFKTIATWREKE